MRVLNAMVSGFEDEEFQLAMADAKAKSDVPARIALPTGIQTRAFTANGTLGLRSSRRRGLIEEAVAPLLTWMNRGSEEGGLGDAYRALSRQTEQRRLRSHKIRTYNYNKLNHLSAQQQLT